MKPSISPEHFAIFQSTINKTILDFFGPQQSTTQSTQSTSPQSISQQKKKKRNQKTRLQYKRRNLGVTVQELEHQELEHSAGAQSSDEAIKHVVLKAVARWLAVACWHAVIQWNEMTRNETMDPYGSTKMPRHGIG